MKCSWENELIVLIKTGGSSFDIFAKDIQKKTGRLSFSNDEHSAIYFEIEEPYRHRHYASNAVYIFDANAHDVYQAPVLHACIEKQNSDAKHILEHHGYECMKETENQVYYEHRQTVIYKDDDYHPIGYKVLYLAGGCFWGMEKVFQQLDGVKETTVGYANGVAPNPTYEEVCRNTTGYKETVRVTYDPSVTLTETLLKAYFLCIDPTVKNQQSNDTGSQYQTGVYFKDPELLPDLERVFTRERAKHAVFYVECEKLSSFYEAEEYHQDYLVKNPQGYCHITATEIELVKALNHQK